MINRYGTIKCSTIYESKYIMFCFGMFNGIKQDNRFVY